MSRAGCQVGLGGHVGLAALVVACAMGAGCTGERPAPSTSAVRPSTRGARRRAPTRELTTLRSRQRARATLPLIPKPRSSVACDGSLAVGAVNGIVVDDHPAARAVGLRLAEWLGVGASLVRAIAAGAPGPAHAIVLRLDVPAAPAQRDAAVEPPRDLEDGRTRSTSRPTARSFVRATRRACSTPRRRSRQLARSRALGFAPPRAGPRPPRMCRASASRTLPRYRFRAMHLDVARHFFSKEVVERYVDLLSFYRFNVLHWHLTDDQGFRLSIRSHPELTQVGARAGGGEHVGYYTQDDAREVVAFARERFVTVVPEIEMPGHARAILASHPGAVLHGQEAARCPRRGASSRTCSAPATRPRTRSSRTCSARPPRCFPRGSFTSAATRCPRRAGARARSAARAWPRTGSLLRGCRAPS